MKRFLAILFAVAVLSFSLKMIDSSSNAKNQEIPPDTREETQP